MEIAYILSQKEEKDCLPSLQQLLTSEYSELIKITELRSNVIYERKMHICINNSHCKKKPLTF